MVRIIDFFLVILVSPLILIDYFIDRILDDVKYAYDKDDEYKSVRKSVLIFGAVCLVLGFIIGLFF